MINDQRKALPYYKALDGLRGLAILLVLMSHSLLLHYGWVGVQLFFVLSGFLITSILLKEKEKPVSLKIKFRNFWLRRVLRIFPLYYLYLIFIIIYWWSGNELHDQSFNIPWLFTYTFNFSGWFKHTLPNNMSSHLWTLSVEEQFYIVYPFLVLLCNRKNLQRVTIVLIILAVAFRFFTTHYLINAGWTDGETGSFIYSSTFSHFDAFLLGGSIMIFRVDKLTEWYKYFIFFVISILTILLGLWVYLTIRQDHFNFNDYITHLGYTPDFVKLQHPVWSYFVINLLFACLLVLLISPGKFLFGRWLGKIFSFNPLVAIGKVSYGIYIIQSAVFYFILFIAHSHGIYNKYIIFLIYLPIVYVLAFIIYHVYEKRFLVLKDKFR